MHNVSELNKPRRGGGLGARLDHWLGFCVEIPAAFLVLAEIITLFAGIVARYVVHRPITWSDEVASSLFLWLAMLGAVVALRRRRAYAHDGACCAFSTRHRCVF